MASFSKELARSISSTAALAFFLVVIFQVPLFRIPCESGVCKSPLKITSSQWLASEVFPEAIVKGILYPATLLNSIIEHRTLPRSYNDFVKSFGSINVEVSSPAATMDLQHIEVLVGSYMMVVGAFMSLVTSVRMSFFGTLIITWSCLGTAKSTQLYPTMILAIVLAFLSIRKDVRKIVRTCKDWRWHTHLKQKFL